MHVQAQSRACRFSRRQKRSILPIKFPRRNEISGNARRKNLTRRVSQLAHRGSFPLIANEDLAAARRSPWGAQKIVRNRKTLISPALHSLLARSCRAFCVADCGQNRVAAVGGLQQVTANIFPRKIMRDTHPRARTCVGEKERRRGGRTEIAKNHAIGMGLDDPSSGLTGRARSDRSRSMKSHRRYHRTPLTVPPCHRPRHTVAIAVITASSGMRQRSRGSTLPRDRLRSTRETTRKAGKKRRERKGASSRKKGRTREKGDRVEKEEEEEERDGPTRRTVLRRKRKRARAIVRRCSRQHDWRRRPHRTSAHPPTLYRSLPSSPPSSCLSSPLLASRHPPLTDTRAHQERSVESVPGAAALVSAIRRGWGIADGGGDDGSGGGRGGDGGGGGAELT